MQSLVEHGGKQVADRRLNCPAKKAVVPVGARPSEPPLLPHIRGGGNHLHGRKAEQLSLARCLLGHRRRRWRCAGLDALELLSIQERSPYKPIIV